MVRWVIGSILHGGPIDLFLAPVSSPRLVYYPVCGMMHIKEPLLLIGNSSLCGGSGFPLSLSEWPFTICMTPYNRKENVAGWNEKLLNGSIMKDRSDDQSHHERTLLPWSYVSLLRR